jgi:hypothetical protein
VRPAGRAFFRVQGPNRRQGELLAARQGCPSRGGIRRKPEAKHWSDEQEGQIEANARGETAKIVKVQSLHGTRGRISDGHKCGRECALLGEISGFALS